MRAFALDVGEEELQTRLEHRGGDPSLRLKSGYAPDDAQFFSWVRLRVFKLAAGNQL